MACSAIHGHVAQVQKMLTIEPIRQHRRALPIRRDAQQPPLSRVHDQNAAFAVDRQATEHRWSAFARR